MRAFLFLPSHAVHPKHYRRLTAAEFEALTGKEKIAVGSSCTQGHLGTDFWQHEELGLIIQAHFQDRPDIFIIPYCRFGPSDMIDEQFIWDALAYAYELTFNRPTDRLQIFADRDAIEIFEYLEARGIKFKRPPDEAH
ncbi:MAG: hypothetical protein K6U03_05145 [Firmicutes bacterium]|nr:hypothetical protein [Bacillota bacterium]